MNTMLVVAGVVVAAAAIVALVMSWSRGGNTADMGAVSGQWIAEHRLGSGQDSRR
jgi:preprotein translocase subunit SecG